MRFLGLAGAALLAIACGRDWESFVVKSTTDAGTDGGGGVGGGACFPGAKVCPDPKTGTPICLSSNTPETGCQSSTACDPCALPHATAKCSDKGKCVVDACQAPYADCDGDPTDGCETNVNTDKLHCGSCETNCVTAKGPGWICDGAGFCEANECCPDGSPTCVNKNDCDKDKTNGCEVDVGTDTNNCGACGNVCALPHTAAHTCDLTCRVAICESGWANCDGNDSNGCETHIDANSANCGACSKVCNSTNGGAACVSGKCQISCNAGFADCNGDAELDGCEVNVANDKSNCGICGNVCSLSKTTGPTCSNATCGFSGCVSGYANCDGQVGNGCERNVTSDPSNCGACSTVCTAPANAAAYCTSSSCGFTCNAGFHACSDAKCYSNNDVAHCGASCTNCPSVAFGNATCTSGTCGITCNSGYNLCGMLCVGVATDPSNCGTCGHMCGPGALCTGGACTCGSGLKYCNDALGCKECCSPGSGIDCAVAKKCCATYICGC